jgi:hypothetical protein
MTVWVLMHQYYEDTWVEGVFTEEGKQKKNAEMTKFAREKFQEKIRNINHNLELFRKDRAHCSQNIQKLSKVIKEAEDTEVKKMAENDKKYFLSIEKKFSSEILRLEKELSRYSEEKTLDEYLRDYNLEWREHELNT